jgi:hypothetical protein
MARYLADEYLNTKELLPLNTCMTYIQGWQPAARSTCLAQQREDKRLHLTTLIHMNVRYTQLCWRRLETCGVSVGVGLCNSYRQCGPPLFCYHEGGGRKLLWDFESLWQSARRHMLEDFNLHLCICASEHKLCVYVFGKKVTNGNPPHTAFSDGICNSSTLCSLWCKNRFIKYNVDIFWS